MAWFISTSDIIIALIIGVALLMIAIGKTSIFIIDHSGIKSNRAHGFIILAVLAAYLGLFGSAAYWWFA